MSIYKDWRRKLWSFSLFCCPLPAAGKPASIWSATLKPSKKKRATLPGYWMWVLVAVALATANPERETLIKIRVFAVLSQPAGNLFDFAGYFSGLPSAIRVEGKYLFKPDRDSNALLSYRH
jgi:hypothetical protein